MNDSEITDLFNQWNGALQTKDPKKVSALYEENGILIPTLSNKVRRNHEEIEDYFTHFLACLLYTSPSPRDATLSRMPSSA